MKDPSFSKFKISYRNFSSRIVCIFYKIRRETGLSLDRDLSYATRPEEDLDDLLSHLTA